MSKAGILKAIKTGKVSAQKDVHGQWEIAPVELFRVYAPVSANVHSQVSSSPQPIPQPSVDGLQREVDLLREMVTDLRSRLDAEVEERRKLTLILTDMRSTQPVQPPATPQQTAQPQRSWWARVWGGSE